MKKLILLFVIGISVSLLSGCAMYYARFSPPVKQETNVILKENDFKTIERCVNGSHSCVFINLGYYPLLSLEIPLGDPRLFSNALADMYSKSQEMTEGKSAQMINWTLDQNDFFIPIPFVTPSVKSAEFQADIIEFTK